MTRLRQCLKRELVAVAEGIRLSSPDDILLDIDNHKAAVVVIAKGSTPQLHVVASASAIQSFDTEKLALASLDDIFLARQVPSLVQLIEQDAHMRNRPVLSTKGEPLGKIVDVVLDGGGNVLEYRVRKGILDTLLRRSHAVLPSEIQTSGVNVAVIDQPPAAEPSSEDKDDPSVPA